MASPSSDAERDQLIQSLSEMFPDAPVAYLEQECEDLIGKPAALERFIEQLSASNGRPPDYWQFGAALGPPPAKKTNIESFPGESHTSTTPLKSETSTVSPEVRELVESLTAIFPDTPLAYLEEQCEDLVGKPAALDRFVSDLATSQSRPPPDWKPRSTVHDVIDLVDLPQVFQDLIETEGDKADKRLANLIAVFPSVDPDFLQQKGNEFGYNDDSEEALNRWIEMHIDKEYKNFPTRVDHEKRIKQAEDQTQKAMMSVEDMLDMYENPEDYFKDQNRDTKRDDDVWAFIRNSEEQHQQRIEWARAAGILIECKCCYSDDCLEEDMLPCKGGHLFCKECIQRASVVAIGEGQTQLKCLGLCEEDFKLSTLQRALRPIIYAKWLKKIQLDQLEKAGVEGLEQCPFCPFATIMNSTPDENKIFNCQNPDCAKESCRLCREVNHIPQRCEEVEKDADVQKRKELEERMSEALIRRCYKCKKPIVKTTGCNHMTCSCGAQMCYVCKEPYRQCKRERRCMTSHDTTKLHREDVAAAGGVFEEAKDKNKTRATGKTKPTGQQRKRKR